MMNALPRASATASDITATVADQVLLSCQNFALGAVFITFAQKPEYGTYVLLFGALLLVSSLQYAALLTPFTAHASRLRGADRARYVDEVFAIQVVLGIALAFAAAIAAHASRQSMPRQGEWLAPAFALAVLGAGLRDFRRAEQVIENRLKGLLASDAASVLITLVGTGAYILAGSELTATVVLLFSGLGCLLTSGRWIHTYAGLNDCAKRMKVTVSDLTGAARWTLPWTLLSWVQNNSYPYLIAIFGGPLAVADVAAARLVVSPVTVVGTGWARLFLARASALLAGGETKEVLVKARRAALWLGAGISIYVLIVSLVFVLGLTSKVIVGYRGIGVLVVIWGACFLASTTRGVASTALLAFRENRVVFIKTLVAVGASLPLMTILGLQFGPGGVLAGIAAGEGLLAVLVWRALHSAANAKGKDDGRLEGAFIEPNSDTRRRQSSASLGLERVDN